jgi:hypothetical protein
MFTAAALRDRLPSAAAAIGVQLAIAALLAMSFEVMRQVTLQKETILYLPPLARPVLPRPRVIDARGAARPNSPAPPAAENTSPAFPAAPPALALPATPGNALLPAPGQAGADCAAPGGAGRNACPPPQAGPRSDEIPLHPESHVKNAPVWQSEIDRRNTPPRVPCVSLTNSVAGMGGFVREDHGARLDIGCALKALRDGPSLLPPVQGLPGPDTPPPHASGPAFDKALQAINARKRLLYAKSAPPPDAAAGASP